MRLAWLARGFSWQLILTQAPALMKAAADLLTLARQKPAATAGDKAAPSVADRLAELEEHREASADLVKNLTEQLNAIAQVGDATAARARLALIIGAAGAAFGLVACALLLLQ